MKRELRNNDSKLFEREDRQRAKLSVEVDSNSVRQVVIVQLRGL